jgi:hypothetical protein
MAGVAKTLPSFVHIEGNARARIAPNAMPVCLRSELDQARVMSLIGAYGSSFGCATPCGQPKPL